MSSDTKVGFSGPSTPAKKPGKPKTSIVYQHDFNGLIPGDVALAAEAALRAMNLDFEEVATLQPGQLGGQTEEIPFVRHQCDDGVEIPFGTFRVAQIGDVTMRMTPFKEVPTLRLTGTLAKKEMKAVWKDYLAQVRKLAATQSIFKGRAVRVEDQNDLVVPKLMALDKPVALEFNADVVEELETVLFYPLLHREKCHEHGIRTRRGVILEGHYGAGKSLLLYKAAQLAHEAGWGVLHITAGLAATALELSKLLEPVVIVIEDIDASTHGDRDRLNNLLNRLSSVATKATGDYALLLSTNFIDRIDPALLRPERIDAIVHIELPNEDTVRRQIDLFGGALAKDLKFPEVEKLLAGTTPAIISEVVQRAKIDALRNGGRVEEARLLFHAKRMEKQRALATPVFRGDTVADRLAESLAEVVNK